MLINQVCLLRNSLLPQLSAVDNYLGFNPRAKTIRDIQKLLEEANVKYNYCGPRMHRKLTVIK